MYILIVILPLIGSIIAGSLGNRLGEKGTGVVTSMLMCVVSVLSMYSVYEVGLLGNNVHLEIIDWIKVLDSSWAFKFDSLTVTMLLLVTTVSALVHIYSLEYMKEDDRCGRFDSFVSRKSFLVKLVGRDGH